MHVTPLGAGIFSIENQGVRNLGIAVGASKGSLLGTLAKLKQFPALIISADDSSIQKWNIEGFFAHEDLIIAHGSWLEEPESYAQIYIFSAEKAIQRTVLLTQAVSRLGKELPDSGLFLDGFISVGQHSVLFLPVQVQELMRAGKNVKDRFLPYDALHNSALRGQHSWAFSLSVLAYRLATGFFPYEFQASAEEFTSRIVTKTFETPQCRFPDAPEALEKLYQQLLIRQEFDSTTIASLPAVFQLWPGVLASAMPKATVSLSTPVNRAQKDFASRFRAFRTRRFVKNNSIWLSVVASVLLVFGIIAGSIVGYHFRVPATAGMNPHQVVEIFYNSLNTFDTEMLQDATRNDAAAALVGEITNLYVVDRVRSSSENRKIHFTPQEWNQTGQAGAEYNLMVYGIDNLKIALNQQEMENGLVRAKVEYDFYSNVSSTEGNDQVNPVLPRTVRVAQKKQELVVEKDSRGYWAITAIRDSPPQ